MDNTVKVSIILPIYNVGPFFEQCMVSVVGQTFKHLEIILVDDGSTDDSGEIADCFARTDGRIKVIHQSNHGVSHARNTGIKNATGDYICFSDPDDILQPDYVEYMLSLCLENHCEISVCAEVFTPFKRVQPSDQLRVVTGEDAASEILHGRITVGCYSKMFLRSFLIDNNIFFFENVSIGEGFNFNVLAFCHARNVAISQHKIYYYRLDNTDSAMTKFNIRKCEMGIKAIDIIRDHLVIKSEKLMSACDFAKYSTIGSMFDWVVMADVKEQYPAQYEEWNSLLKKYARQFFSYPTSRKMKVAMAIRSVSPWLWAYLRLIGRKILLKKTDKPADSVPHKINRGGVNLLCAGCRVCELVCPHQAITLAQDEEGFCRAVIDEKKCTNCGTCYRACPQNKPVVKYAPQRVYAVRYKNDEILYKSASGGAYAALALAVIRSGGVVFGVVYDKDWNAVFTSAETEEDLMPILSSKYVQADTGDSYREVKKQLQRGRHVLYCGTGCQIGGLKAYLHKDYDNLITIDLICHGVTSPLLFRKYMSWLSEKHGSPILEYDFRDKRGGWGLGYKYKYKYKYVYHSCNLDPYYYHFLKGDAYRECCYRCNYCTKERVGDITIGDYWGIEKEHPQFFSTKGVSVVLLNSKKGVDFFGSIDNLFYICESTFEQAAKHNQNLLRPTHRLAERNTIYEDIADRDFADLSFVKAFRPSWKSRLKELIPLSVKLLIKKSQK